MQNFAKEMVYNIWLGGCFQMHLVDPVLPKLNIEAKDSFIFKFYLFHN